MITWTAASFYWSKKHKLAWSLELHDHAATSLATLFSLVRQCSVVIAWVNCVRLDQGYMHTSDPQLGINVTDWLIPKPPYGSQSDNTQVWYTKIPGVSRIPGLLFRLWLSLERGWDYPYQLNFWHLHPPDSFPSNGLACRNCFAKQKRCANHVQLVIINCHAMIKDFFQVINEIPVLNCVCQGCHPSLWYEAMQCSCIL